MIRAIIFDLNGVFIKSPMLSDRFRDDFGVNTAEFIAALKEIMDKVRLPAAQDCYEYWQPYLEKWGVDLNKNNFYKYWFEAEEETPEMITLAKDLVGSGIKLFVLSNNFRERTEYYKENFPFMDKIFEKVYYSWQTGFRKPEKEAYEKILKDNDLRPEECLYFDDSEKNITVARELGIAGFLFEGSGRTREIIDGYFKNNG